jgi:hypothetical protein
MRSRARARSLGESKKDVCTMDGYLTLAGAVSSVRDERERGSSLLTKRKASSRGTGVKKFGKR